MAGTREKGNERLGLTSDGNNTGLLAQSAPWRPGAAAKRAKAVVQKSVGEKGAEGGSWVEVWFVWSENPWQHTVASPPTAEMQPMWTNAGHSRVPAEAVELVCAKTSPLSRLGCRGFAFFLTSWLEGAVAIAIWPCLNLLWPDPTRFSQPHQPLRRDIH